MEQSNPMTPSNTSVPGSGYNQNAWIAYLLGWITGLIMYFSAKDQYTKFHGAQSILLGIVLTVLYTVFANMLWSFGMFWQLLQLAVIALSIFLMVKAYKGEKYKLPVIGDLAESWSKK